MSESDTLVKAEWLEKFLGIRLPLSEQALRERFDDLTEAEGERLKSVRDALPRAAKVVAEQKLPKRLKAASDELELLLAGRERPDKLPDLGSGAFALEVAYDVTEGLQSAWFDQVPTKSFQDIILGDNDKAKAWQDSFVEWIAGQDRDIDAIAEQLLEKRVLAPQRKGKVMASVSGPAGKSGYTGAEALGRDMSNALDKCPALEKHMGEIFGVKGAPTLVFSDTAKDAFYNKTGDRQKGIPDNIIVLPKGKPAPDLMDGLIFETCNAEIQKEYDTLNKDLTARLQNNSTQPALTAADYGNQKATIEAKAVLKDTQLKFAMLSDGVPPAYQGQRNLLAMLQTCRSMKGATLEDAEAIIEDPVRLAKCLEENKAELGEFLKQADTDPESRNAILAAMTASPHNRNAGPTDKNSLSTADLYAYEMLENTSSQLLANMVLKEVMPLIPKGKVEVAVLRKFVVDWINAYDFPSGEKIDRSARNKVFETIIAEFKRFVPAATFESFAATEAMQAMATTRSGLAQQGKPKVFEDGAKKEELYKRQLQAVLGT